MIFDGIMAQPACIPFVACGALKLDISLVVLTAKYLHLLSLVTAIRGSFDWRR
jgi:hypothetical protein